MDDRIAELQERADQLSQTLEATTGRLAGEIALLRAQAEDLAREHVDLARLRAENEALRAERDALVAERDALLAENAPLREVRTLAQRYAVACAAVDLQNALLRRDPASVSPTALNDLQRAIEEEKAASDILRDAARRFPNEERDRTR